MKLSVDQSFGDLDEKGCCTLCGHKLEIGDHPMCPHGHGTAARTHDDIPGGIVLENYGPDPVKVYSHTERRAIMRAQGLSERVRHVGVPGTDKSPHTTDWSKGSIDAQTLENARALVSRAGGRGVNDSDGPREGVVRNGAITFINEVLDEQGTRHWNEEFHKTYGE